MYIIDIAILDYQIINHQQTCWKIMSWGIHWALSLNDWWLFGDRKAPEKMMTSNLSCHPPKKVVGMEKLWNIGKTHKKNGLMDNYAKKSIGWISRHERVFTVFTIFHEHTNHFIPKNEDSLKGVFLGDRVLVSLVLLTYWPCISLYHSEKPGFHQAPWNDHLLLLMEEILHHLGCIKLCK